MGYFQRLRRYYRDQERLFADNAQEVLDGNTKLLGRLLVLCVLLMSALLLVSLVSESFSTLTAAYLALLLMGGTLWLLFRVAALRRFALLGLYLDFSMSFVLMIYLSVVGSPQHMAVSIIGLFCIMPLAILDKSWRINLFILTFYTLHTLLAFRFKESGVAFDDAVTCACFALLGAFLGEYVRSMKLENYEVKRQVQRQAEMDFLTGLYNRRKLFTHLEQVRQESGAAQVSGVLMLDIDHFKDYNDTFGHLAGDECLRRLSAAMREFGRGNQMDFFRYGGEEFLALYHEAQQRPLLRLAEELRNLVWELDIPFPGSRAGRVTVSVGYALAEQNQGVVDERLVRMADSALYSAKAAGRNQSRAYGAEAG